MAEEIKDVNAKIDEAEAAVKKYASKDTVISIGGYENFRGAGKQALIRKCPNGETHPLRVSISEYIGDKKRTLQFTKCFVKC